MSLIFVGGIHGAGKTALCEALAESIGAVHYSAGRIIQNRLAAEQTGRDKTVSDVNANQRALLAAVDELRLSATSILLDGHFTVLSADGGVSEIPVEVFWSLQPRALIVVDTDPEEAAERIRKRDGTIYPRSILEALRDSEIRHAQVVSQALVVPLLVARDNVLSSAENFLRAQRGQPRIG